jgi:hypothetical protein
MSKILVRLCKGLQSHKGRSEEEVLERSSPGLQLREERAVSILLFPATGILIEVCHERLELALSGLYRVISYLIAFNVLYHAMPYCILSCIVLYLLKWSCAQSGDLLLSCF